MRQIKTNKGSQGIAGPQKNRDFTISNYPEHSKKGGDHLIRDFGYANV